MVYQVLQPWKGPGCSELSWPARLSSWSFSISSGSLLLARDAAVALQLSSSAGRAWNRQRAETVHVGLWSSLGECLLLYTGSFAVRAFRITGSGHDA